MIKDNKYSRLCIIAIWIIIVTCILTNTFYLKKSILNIAALPISALVALAMFNLRRSFGGGRGQ